MRCKTKDNEWRRDVLETVSNKCIQKVPLERVLVFVNATVPLSLFCDNGKIVTTKKSDFLDKLESIIEPEQC